MTFDLPDHWRKFTLEFDAHRKLWETFCISEAHNDAYWYKGLGATPEASIAQLTLNEAKHIHVGLPIRPSRYVKGAFREATIPPAALADIDLNKLDFKI